MTIQDALCAAEAARPGAVGDEQKLAWLRWLDGELRRSVLALHEPDAAAAARGADAADPPGPERCCWPTARTRRSTSTG